jgi:quinoprotein glucose dehydrogenase
VRSAALLLTALLLACAPEKTWSSWAGDPESTRYLPLEQIDASNFSRLHVAWTWRSRDIEWKEKLTAQSRVKTFRFFYTDQVDIAEFQATPIFVDGVLYGVTAANMVFALDASTGKELWFHNPAAYRSSQDYWDFLWPKQRGVVYWDGRLFLPTSDAYLLAVDAKTGQPIESFGEKGRVDLMEGLRGPPIRRLGKYFQTSPAVMAGDTVVVGSSVHDHPESPRSTPGDIRGYDARTGSLKWTFHVVPVEGEPGTETWEGESWRYSGAANVWGPMSVDSERGWVYAVTSSATNDHYGGHRLGDNLFAETLLCLDGETGRRIWHQQLIRHGLWDYDPSASPVLVDVTVDGRAVEAVAQATKQGFVFVFDRVTGEPVWPIEDRAVPPSDIPGERAAATQPVPTKPPPFERQGTREEDLIDFTPALREKALAVFRQFRTGPLFLPPSFEGSLILPGSYGGTSWRGTAVDPETGILYVPSIQMASVHTIKAVDEGPDGFRYRGTATTRRFDDQGNVASNGLPIFKPPWSKITAIDLTRGDIVWQVANGEGPKRHPLLAGLDLPRLGSGVPTGILVTKTLVITTDGSEHWFPELGEPIVRAYDKATGDLVGEVTVPDKVRGVPMTYLWNGVQYVAMSISSKERQDPRLIALALP